MKKGWVEGEIEGEREEIEGEEREREGERRRKGEEDMERGEGNKLFATNIILPTSVHTVVGSRSNVEESHDVALRHGTMATGDRQVIVKLW